MKVKPNVMVQFPEPMQKLIEMAHEKTYSKGEILHYGDLLCDSFQIIVDGKLRRYGTCDQVSDSDTYNDKGRDVLFEHLVRGDVMGEGLILMSEDESFYYDSMVEAETPVVIASIGRQALNRFKEAYPEHYAEICGMVGRMTLVRLNLMRHILNEMVNLDAKERIRTTLNRMCAQPNPVKHPDGIQLHLSRQDLALMVGCSREVAGRVVNEMKDAGHLYAKGKTIVIFGGVLPEMF